MQIFFFLKNFLPTTYRVLSSYIWRKCSSSPQLIILPDSSMLHRPLKQLSNRGYATQVYINVHLRSKGKQGIINMFFNCFLYFLNHFFISNTLYYITKNVAVYFQKIISKNPLFKFFFPFLRKHLLLWINKESSCKAMRPWQMKSQNHQLKTFVRLFPETFRLLAWISWVG